jgi:hypothetical protein
MAMLIYPSLYAGRKTWAAIPFNGIVDENIKDCACKFVSSGSRRRVVMGPVY